jgi:hypothetical protein
MKAYIYYLHYGDDIPFYVGKSINPENRNRNHILKYGDCYLEILDEVELKNWVFWERYWISQFLCWGFKLKNQNQGGGGPEYYTNYSKTLMSASKKGNKYKLGKKISEEAKLKISKSLMGNQHRLGYKTPDDVKQKISKSMTRKVEQYDLTGNFIKEWDSIKSINEWFNIKGYNLITRVCRGESKSCKGFIWKYKNK